MDNVTQIAGLAGPDVRELRSRIAGEVYVPGDDAWDEARQAWNLAVDQRPTAVVVVEGANDVAATIDFARENDLRVAPQGTGHAASAFADMHDTILLKTHRLRGVTIDAERRIARAEAGAIWIDVVEAAAEHGLAALAGSSPDVGVVGYTLGGGLSWLARKHGIGANNVTAIELVTSDGEFKRVDRDHDPDLFWALRGGGGSFAVVTAIEFNLFPYAQVYAGILWFPVERATEVLTAWRAWTEIAPDELTSVGRIMQFPPLEFVPEPIRGKSFVIVEAIYAGDPVDGEHWVAPLRELGPVMDTVQTMSMPELSRLHMDPEGPAPGVGDGTMLTAFDDEAIQAFVANTVGSPLLSAEVRHLGGAVARPKAEHGALSHFEHEYLTFAVGIAPVPPAAAAVHGALERLFAALEPWTAEQTYSNFAERGRKPGSFHGEAAYHRLKRIKAQVDPANVIRANHEL
jgi:UDP-N-acetylenolpyruvoylglucosamine reductase